MTAFFQIESGAQLECRELHGEERLGEPARFEASVLSPRPLDVGLVLGRPCSIHLDSRHGRRDICAIVTRVEAIATSRADTARAYRITARSRFDVLGLRRRSRIFQHLSIPDVVAQVLSEGGYRAHVRRALAAEHALREYVVQYAESDADFVRRLCEDEGVYFYFEADGDAEIVVLADSSTSAPAALDAPLRLVERGELNASGPNAFAWRSVRRRRPGKMTVRGYEPRNPQQVREATVEAGTEMERGVEIYVAPPAGEPQRTDERARTGLESARADALTCTFSTTALALAPGHSVTVEPDGAYGGPIPASTEYVIVGVRHRWSFDSEQHVFEATAVPRDVRYRLERKTPRPRICGVQSAVVTGAPGAEIHPDELGRVFVKFHWDVDGPTDHRSSLPIRVVQPNTPGSMLLPRVGWEVVVAFEDGDPERPYVIGRSYNGRMRPPFSLPANKTITSFATDSSPGGASRSSIHFDDANGRQHIKFQAPFGKDLTVGGNMVVQTGVNERLSVSGAASRTVVGDDSVSVGQAFFETVGSQSVNIGGVHKFTTIGHQQLGLGSETVIVLGAQVEQVGNPAKGVVQLGASAAIHGVSSRGTAGAVIGAGLGIAKAAYDGYQHDGIEGAERAAKGGVAGILASFVPGGDAVLAGITGASHPNPWDAGNPKSGVAAPGGGAGGGITDASGPGGPGPGYRNVVVGGNAIEVIGDYSIATPGPIASTTVGHSILATAGSKTMQGANVGFRVAGASMELVGSHSIEASGSIGRKARGFAEIRAGGALTATGASYSIKGPQIHIGCGGALTLNGGAVSFTCGGASIVVDGSGVYLKANEIEITGACKQTGDMTHL